ncbi:MAG: hypothetical protein AAF621_07595 [Pseudomonadota bacterium]
MIYVIITVLSLLVIAFLGFCLVNSTSTKQRRQIILILCVPVCAVGVYLYLGSPNYPDQPYRQVQVKKEALSQKSPEDLISALRDKLNENDNVEARFFLGTTLFKVGRIKEALSELKKAYLLSNKKDNDIAFTYAKILTSHNNEIIPTEALDIFKNIPTDHATYPQSLFYQGLYYFQNGQSEKGYEEWDILVEQAENQPWKFIAIDNILNAAVKFNINIDKYGLEKTGSKAKFTQEDIDMISQMVESLRQKAKDDPDNIMLQKRLEEVEKKFRQIKENFVKKSL